MMVMETMIEAITWATEITMVAMATVFVTVMVTSEELLGGRCWQRGVCRLESQLGLGRAKTFGRLWFLGWDGEGLCQHGEGCKSRLGENQIEEVRLGRVSSSVIMQDAAGMVRVG